MSAKEDRKARIEAAAYEILERDGFQAASMLKIAKSAKASNETLYAWYGDKIGLFKALVEGNADAVRDTLEAGLRQDRPARDLLQDLGPQLLSMLLGPRAIALNRAAAADASGALGVALAESGRARVLPVIQRLFEAARASGDLQFNDAAAALGLYIDVLVGDLQIRRATGALPPLTEDAIALRADRALARFKCILAAEAL